MTVQFYHKPQSIKQKTLFLVFAVFVTIPTLFFLLSSRISFGEGQKILRTTSVEARLTAAQNQLSRLYGYTWLTGNGLFVSTPEKLTLTNHAILPDSWLITLLVGTGGIGLCLWLALLYRYRNLGLGSGGNAGLVQLYCLLAIVHALSINSFFYGFTWLWICLAIGSETKTKATTA
jgi:hypothetical protein